MIHWKYDHKVNAWLTPWGWIYHERCPHLPPRSLSWPKGSQWIGDIR